MSTTNLPVTVAPGSTGNPDYLPGKWTGFALPALLVLLTFVCATGFYIVERPTSAALPAHQAATAKATFAVSNAYDYLIGDRINRLGRNRSVTLTLHSRIIESFTTNRNDISLTLFPRHDQFQSLFPDSGRVTTFFDIDEAFKQHRVSELQTELPILASSTDNGQMHEHTSSTAMMLRYVGAGFPNVGTWFAKFGSIDEVAYNFNSKGVPLALLPEQYFRALLTTDALANVKCNGHSARTVNRRADRYRTRVEKLADRYAVDPNLVLAVAAQESCFYRKAVSPVGAQGLMQLMPATASMLGVDDAYNADDNLKGGIRYLSMLQKQFETPELVLAAYNAGPGSVKRHNGIPPYSETQRYVTKVLSFYRSFAAADGI